jgi:hypothetical protein
VDLDRGDGADDTTVKSDPLTRFGTAGAPTLAQHPTRSASDSISFSKNESEASKSLGRIS